MSILDGLQAYLTSSLVKTVSQSLDESQAGVSTALHSLLPTILGGLVQKAESDRGLDQVFGVIETNGNPAWLDDLPSLIKQGNLAHGDPKDHAGHLLSALFGNKVSKLLDLVHTTAGLRERASASALLGLVGPLVMGFLNKKVVGNGMNANGLIALLYDQKEEILTAIPAAIRDQLGLHPTPDAVEPTANRGGTNVLTWLLPLLVIGGALFYFLNVEAEEEVDAPVESSVLPAPTDTVPPLPTNLDTTSNY